MRIKALAEDIGSRVPRNYSDSMDHIMDVLSLLNICLAHEVKRFRIRHAGSGGHELRGLCITDQEIDTLFDAGPGPDGAALVDFEQHGPEEPESGFEERVSLHRYDIEQRRAAAVRQGLDLRLDTLRHRFGLDSFSQEILACCLAPEIDPAYGKVYAYLNDDVTKRFPTAELLLRLLGSDFRKEHFRKTFSSDSPIMAHRLIRLRDVSSDIPGPFTQKSVTLDGRIFEFLMGSDSPDEFIGAATQLHSPSGRSFSPIMFDGVKDNIEKLMRLNPAETRPVLAFVGPEGSGKKTWVLSVAGQWGLPVLMVKVTHLFLEDGDFGEAFRLAFREATLQGAAPCLVGLESLASEGKPLSRVMACLQNIVSEFEGPVFVTCEEKSLPVRFPRLVRIDIPRPDYRDRIVLWESMTDRRGKGRNGKRKKIDPVELAGTFRLTPGQMKETVAEARNFALLRCGDSEKLTREDIFKSARTCTAPDMAGLASHIRPSYRWKDLVLPSDVLKLLVDIGAALKNRERVYHEWGFDGKFAHGRGLNVLFCGPSGTGKTMAAEILAGEMGLDMYKIDISRIVSKYIGETEKHLRCLFDAAERSNTVLFFDEADALFGKRSEVHDAKDRYANIEVSYLLQKMEEHDGHVILATNFKQNLDDAFMRRLQYLVEFPFPGPDMRECIWKGMFPKDTPLDSGIDFHFLAQRFELAGGNLRSVALGAAFLASDEGRSITMGDIIISMAREFHKLGRLCTETDFGPYLELVHARE